MRSLLCHGNLAHTSWRQHHSSDLRVARDFVRHRRRNQRTDCRLRHQDVAGDGHRDVSHHGRELGFGMLPHMEALQANIRQDENGLTDSTPKTGKLRSSGFSFLKNLCRLCGTLT